MMNEKLISVLAASAVAAGGLTLAAPTSARQQPAPVVVTAPERDDVPIRRVSYRDLNLTTLAGEKKLNRRVSGAVREVCYESLGNNPQLLFEVKCRKNAWDGARPQIALAIERARQMAQNGYSSIAPVAISIAFSLE